MAELTYRLVCAPAGSGLRVAVGRLAGLLKSEPQDVEDILCEEASATPGLRGVVSYGYGPPNMEQVTSNLPRRDVIGRWHHAFGTALSRLGQSDTATKMVSCHLTLYNKRRGEFYSPLDIKVLTQTPTNAGPLTARLSHVLLLIDDIFDMYLRLTAKGQLFEMPAWMEEHLKQVWKEEENEGEQAFDTDARRRVSVEGRIQILTASTIPRAIQSAPHHWSDVLQPTRAGSGRTVATKRG